MITITTRPAVEMPTIDGASIPTYEVWMLPVGGVIENPIVYEFYADAGETNCKVGIHSAANNTLLQECRVYFDSNGSASLDVAPYLQGFLKNELNYSFPSGWSSAFVASPPDDSLTAVDADAGVSFYLEIFQADGSTYQDSLNIRTGVNAALPQRAHFGNYVAAYEEQPGANVRSLSLFNPPVKFQGYPLDLSFLMQTGVELPNFNVTQTHFIGPGNAPSNSHSVNSASTLSVPSVLRVKVLDPIGSNASVVKLIYIEIQFIDLFSFQEIWVDFRNCTPANAVYVRWLNNQGHWEGWLFEAHSTFGHTTQDATYYEDQHREPQQLSISAHDTLQVRTTNLTRNQAEAIRSLARAAGRYIQTKTGALTPVGIQPGTFKVWESSRNRHEAEFTLVLGALNTQLG